VTNAAVFERRESHVRSYSRTVDAIFDTASGSIMRDVEGREYIDFLSGAGSLNYGHNDPDMRAALIDYLMRDGITHGLDLFTTRNARSSKRSKTSSLRRVASTTKCSSRARPAPTASRQR
jgi:4-aminobutyrate aminotransferase-like enzyme